MKATSTVEVRKEKVFRKERGQKILSGAISHKICCSCFFFFLPPTEAENSALRCFWPNLWTDSKWPISFFRRNWLLSIGNVVRELISVRSARNEATSGHGFADLGSLKRQHAVKVTTGTTSLSFIRLYGKP